MHETLRMIIFKMQRAKDHFKFAFSFTSLKCLLLYYLPQKQKTKKIFKNKTSKTEIKHGKYIIPNTYMNYEMAEMNL